MKKQLVYNWFLNGTAQPGVLNDFTFTYLHIQRTNAAISLVATPTGSPTITSIVWEVRNKSGVLKGLSFSSTASIPAISLFVY